MSNDLLCDVRRGVIYLTINREVSADAEQRGLHRKPSELGHGMHRSATFSYLETADFRNKHIPRLLPGGLPPADGGFGTEAA